MYFFYHFLSLFILGISWKVQLRPLLDCIFSTLYKVWSANLWAMLFLLIYETVFVIALLIVSPHS